MTSDAIERPGSENKSCPHLDHTFKKKKQLSRANEICVPIYIDLHKRPVYFLSKKLLLEG